MMKPCDDTCFHKEIRQILVKYRGFTSSFLWINLYMRVDPIWSVTIVQIQRMVKYFFGPLWEFFSKRIEKWKRIEKKPLESDSLITEEST